MIAHLPVVLVVDRDAVGQRIGFGKIDQPAAGMSAVVQEQQGTSDDFMRLEELRVLQSRADGFEALNVTWLYNKTRIKLTSRD